MDDLEYSFIVRRYAFQGWEIGSYITILFDVCFTKQMRYNTKNNRAIRGYHGISKKLYATWVCVQI